MKVSPVIATGQRLVRAVEVWTPDSEGRQLQWSSGVYEGMDDFRAVSQETTFKPGEGLPGKVWDTRSPIVLHNLCSGEFKRADAARQYGLSCGIGWPCFGNGKFAGVLVFLLDSGHDLEGAFELWSPNERRELGLSDGYYANLEAFGRISHFVKFPCGAGLPGQAWQMRFPRLVSSLATSPAFMRGAGSQANGLDVGLAIPMMRSAWELDSVLLLLSSRTSPIARAFEVWMKRSDGRLTRHAFAYDDVPELSAVADVEELEPGDGVAGYVTSHGYPWVCSQLETCESQRAEALQAAGIQHAVGLPVYVGDTIVGGVVLFL